MIIELEESLSNHHAVTVRKRKGKTVLFMCYFKGKVTIRTGYGRIKEIIIGTSEAELIAKLNQLGYAYTDLM